MKKILLFLAAAMVAIPVSAQKGGWAKVGADKARGLERVREGSYAENQQLYVLDVQAMRQTLAQAPDKFSGQPGVEILIPNADGALEKFVVWENSNFAPGLQAQFPDIRAYAGKGIDDKYATINFSMSPQGIQTMVLRADKGSEFIEPYTSDRSVYVFFDSKTRSKATLPLVCTTEDVALNVELLRGNETALSNNGVYKTMRLALSCTGEYAQYFGGTVADALAAMNATMTRVNGVFERDLALHLNIIENNTLVIYTNPLSDPYAAASNMNLWNGQLQTTLTNVIGEANYDIGHLFGASGGGGNAGCIGCVCNPGKGSAITSPADNVPMGDFFDIDYVAHEMGHQLGGNHTFSHGGENNQVNVEPGSGSTIMAYAGITGATDVQPHSDDYFTYRSILQIQSNLANKTCPVTVTMTNQTPVISAGPDWTIPKGTAFILTGTGSDADGDALTYTWEQNDDASGASLGNPGSFPAGNKLTGPNFRSLTPTASSVRYMPAYETVLNGSLASTWEAVSTVGRNLNFTLTARDNAAGGGQTQTDATIITVSGTAGPFALTSQNASGISWTQGSTQTVTWSVNNTNTLAGSSNVNIKLSLDNGVTWPITLASNVPNDGSETITVPNVAAPYCRLWIEPVANIYYAVNSTPFAIGYTVTTSCATYNNTSGFAIPDGVGAGYGPMATSNITVPATGTVGDVNVGLNVSHTWPNDLEITLLHNGTSVILWNRACGNNDNFNITLSDGSPNFTCVANMTGTYSPSQPLSAFNGLEANGVWTLQVRDGYQQDTGSVNSWSIEVCTQTATLSTPENGLANFAVYPNPNNGNFNIQFESTSGSGVNVMVHDIRGRAILSRNFANSGLFNQNVSLENAQSGIYMLTVSDGERKEVRKIVVE